MYKCQGEACREGNWKYRHVDLEPVIVPTTGGVVRTEDLCFHLLESASRSDKQQKKVSKGAGNQAAKRRVGEESFGDGWMEHIIRKRYMEAVKILRVEKRSAEMTLKEGMLGLDDDVSELFKFKTMARSRYANG